MNSLKLSTGHREISHFWHIACERTSRRFQQGPSQSIVKFREVLLTALGLGLRGDNLHSALVCPLTLPGPSLHFIFTACWVAAKFRVLTAMTFE